MMLFLRDTASPASPVAVPPSFWAMPAVCEAIEDLDLGAVLALVDRHTDLTQADMVRLTGMAGSEVSRHINGRRRTRNIRIIREALEGLGLPSATERVDSIAAPASSNAGVSGMLESLSRSSSGLLLQVEQEAVGDWSAAAVDEHLRGAASRYLTVPVEETLSDLMQVDEHVSAWRVHAPAPSRARQVWALAGWQDVPPSSGHLRH